MARLLARLPPSTPRQISAVFKIIVGLVQCLSTLRSFSRVLWPDVFTNFILAIDQFTIEALSIVPVECVVGRLASSPSPSPSPVALAATPTSTRALTLTSAGGSASTTSSSPRSSCLSSPSAWSCLWR